MKKFIFIIFSTFLLTGCFHYEELNSLSIISNIAIKYQDNKYSVVMQEIIPKMSGNKINYVYKYRSSKAKSLKKAFKNIINHSPKKIYLNKVQNIIFYNKNKNITIKSFLKYSKDITISQDLSLVVTEDDVLKTLKISSDYKYIDSVLKDKKTTLRKIKKSDKVKVPIIKISDKELIFKKYFYL